MGRAHYASQQQEHPTGQPKPPHGGFRGVCGEHGLPGQITTDNWLFTFCWVREFLGGGVNSGVTCFM